ncbi:MAG: phosphodiester glycosidase family protein [Verrucomicrobiales bacterium]|nr:phosphodiester glycosidase family protein [Verrucomicrobiales bacterium]
MLLLVPLIGGFYGWTCARGPRFLESWPAPGPNFTDWKEVTPGLSYSRANLSEPRPLKCHALRIDLQHPEIEVVAAARPEAVDWFTSAWPSSLLRSEGLLAVINATPFQPEPYLPGPLVKPDGLVVMNGWAVAGPSGNLDALIQSKNGTWSLQIGQREASDAKLAVGGFLVTVASGENRGERHPQDAATAVGLSADRRWMYWLVVDGRQPGYSEGLTPKESAELLKGLGAADAINFDGGGSTAMVLAGGWTGARVVNRPRSPVISGFQRPVACVLGVRRRSDGGSGVGEPGRAN